MKIFIVFLAFIVTSNLLSQDGWFYVSPKPTSNSITKIQFVSSNIGFFLSIGELYKTNDGGLSWSKKTFKTDYYSSSTFRFINRYNGLVVINGNDTAHIFKTTDGGTTFVPTINPYPDLWISSIFFVSNTTVFMAGERGTILKSTNGGLNWTKQTSGTNLHLRAVKFTSETIGYVAGDSAVILKTTDGGTTWTTRFGEYQSTIRNFSFYIQNVGYAATDNQFIYKTTDAGESWVKINTPNKLFYDIYSLTATTSIAVAPHSMYKTTDGGLNWSEVNSDLGGVSVSFLGNTGWAAGHSGALAKSTDAGSSWFSLREGLNGQLDQIHFIDANVGFTYTDDKIFKSTDGGFKWQEFSTNISLQRFLTLCFKSNQIAFIGGRVLTYPGPTNRASMYKTTNQGSTWEQVNLNVPNSPPTSIYDIYFPSSSVGYAVGENKYLIKTTDGGNTWTQIQTNLLNSYDFQRVCFINEQVGWITSSSAEILKTVDGGATWIEINDLYGGTVHSLKFFNESIGYMLSEEIYTASTYLYKTTNGGLNWSLLYLPANDVLVSLSFISQNEFYVGALFGKVFKTTDGGMNWTWTKAPIDNGLLAIHFLNDGLGWGAGLSGFVCKYDKGAFYTDTVTVALWVNNGKNIVIVEPGKKIIEGEEFIFPPYTMPSTFRKYQAIYNALVGSHFYIEQGAIDKSIKLNFAITVPGEDSLYGFIGNKKVWFYGIVEVEGYPLGFFFLNKRGAVLKVPEHKDFGYLIKALGWQLGRTWTFGYYNTETKKWDGIGVSTFNQRYEDSTIVDTAIAKVTHFSEIGAGDEELLTEVKNEDPNYVPKRYLLSQNYPNPFNPNTIINYEIPTTPTNKVETVELRIYDILGRVVETLVNETQSPGRYSVEWKASKYSSGIYFYELKCGGFRDIKKMILMK